MPPVRRYAKYMRQGGHAHPVNTVLSSMANTVVRAVGGAAMTMG